MDYEFEGSRHQIKPFLKSNFDRFYVYLLCRPNGQPFYVGKGSKYRALEHEQEAKRNHRVGESNPFKCNVIRKIIRDGAKILYRIESIYDFENQKDCLERETELIQKYKRLHEGGCLTNLAGGLGAISGPAPLSKERHSATLYGEPDDNPERATLNKFLLSIGPVRSIPIKPVDQMSRILCSTPHPSPRKPTARAAYALIASASANGQLLEEGVKISRSFIYEGVRGVIENGVSRDLLKAEMATLVEAEDKDPLLEKYLLSAQQINTIASLVGRDHLVSMGIL